MRSRSESGKLICPGVSMPYRKIGAMVYLGNSENRLRDRRCSKDATGQMARGAACVVFVGDGHIGATMIGMLAAWAPLGLAKPVRRSKFCSAARLEGVAGSGRRWRPSGADTARRVNTSMLIHLGGRHCPGRSRYSEVAERSESHHHAGHHPVRVGHEQQCAERSLSG